MTEYSSEAVTHNSTSKQFQLDLTPGKPEGKKDYGILDYEMVGETVFNLYHTEVPPSYKGRGIGAFLADRAIRDLTASSKEVKLILSCTYLQHYYNKNKHLYPDSKVQFDM